MYDASSPSILAPRRARTTTVPVPQVRWSGLYRVPTVLYRRYRRYGTYGTTVRERNPLALPTLDMYLPLSSKFESIH